MAIETPKIEWFNGLSPIVKCANCNQWARSMGHLEDPEPSTGTCDVFATTTCDDFYCKYFMLNQQIHVG